MEEYRDIPGYEGKYQVSNLGNVKSLERKDSRGQLRKERIMSKPITSGYYRVGLHSEGYKHIMVHQLVAMAFLGHIPNGHKVVVDHINYNKLDNRVENLRIITPRQNTSKSHINSSSKYVGVFLNKDNGKWRSCIQVNGKSKHLGYYFTEIDAANAYTDYYNKNKII